MTIAVDWDVKHQTKQKRSYYVILANPMDNKTVFEYPQLVFGLDTKTLCFNFMLLSGGLNSCI